jgi:large subunit ribosomal protein L17
VQKAKELRKFVEPLITRAKENTTHNRRTAFAALRQKEVVTELFTVVGPKVGDRPGGYTRIIKTGNRLGDNAEMCMVELVDFNELYTKEEKKKTTRRSRRAKATTEEAASAPTDEAATEEVAVEETKEESAE